MDYNITIVIVVIICIVIYFVFVSGKNKANDNIITDTSKLPLLPRGQVYVADIVDKIKSEVIRGCTTEASNGRSIIAHLLAELPESGKIAYDKMMDYFTKNPSLTKLNIITGFKSMGYNGDYITSGEVLTVSPSLQACVFALMTHLLNSCNILRSEYNQQIRNVQPVQNVQPVVNNVYTDAVQWRDYYGIDSGGNDIKQVGYEYPNISYTNSLRTSCLNTPNCVAVNSEGWLKHSLNDQSLWNIRNSNMFVNSRAPGYNSLRSISRVNSPSIQMNVTGIPYTSSTSSLSWKQYDKVDSVGNDIYQTQETIDSAYETYPPEQLIRICENEPNCVAINSSGWLKHSLNDKSMWNGADSVMYVNSRMPDFNSI